MRYALGLIWVIAYLIWTAITIDDIIRTLIWSCKKHRFHPIRMWGDLDAVDHEISTWTRIALHGTLLFLLSLYDFVALCMLYI